MRIGRFCAALPGAVVGLILLLPALAIALPVWLIALLTRAAERLFHQPLVDWRGIVQYDPVLGWRPRPNVRGYCRSGRDVFHVTTGADGWPGPGEIDRADVLVVGDSHAFGYGVDDGCAFPQLTRGFSVKAVAAPGYNLVQELLVLEELGPRLRGKLVVWFIYHGNDLFDNLVPQMNGYRTPFVRESEGRWEIVGSHVSSDRWPWWPGGRHGRRGLPSLLMLHSDTHLAARAYDACAWLLARGQAACSVAGAHLVVLSIPAPLALQPPNRRPAGFEPDYPDRQLGEICSRLGLPFVPLRGTLTLDHFKPHDDHWTEQGHRCVAGVLERLYHGEPRHAAAESPLAVGVRVSE